MLQRDRDIIDDDRIKIDLIENVLPNHPPSPVSSSKTFGFSVSIEIARWVGIT